MLEVVYLISFNDVDFQIKHIYIKNFDISNKNHIFLNYDSYFFRVISNILIIKKNKFNNTDYEEVYGKR